MSGGLHAHLATGATTLCRLWSLTRADGQVMGFTDHDCDLWVDGLRHRAGSGLTASAMAQTAGLAVDNSEAMGMLSDQAVTEADLIAGRYDGAEICIWLANWADPAQRQLIFRGSLGEVTLQGAAFKAELRGLTEGLAPDRGWSYTRQCSAALGDDRCRFSLAAPGFSLIRAVEEIDPESRILRFAGFADYPARWFEAGRIEALSGPAAGLWAMVKSDRLMNGQRQIELWQALRQPLTPGTQIRLTAGCDKHAATCRAKFNNFMNFRGFPHIPGEDWLMAYPRAGQPAAGGSLFAGEAEHG